ncbi:NRF domain-containing protein [Trichonephila inaurata madagascariensis]|uniref:NRF domain-containing protein n=1 Tax=Trichonephila inaurata madagascariensis TaxID=2747483 RepID=A0A8X6WS66_9ARAC|nr:NRF domain-containing protein [Trichonephila inaurata madagascariensis]
MKDKRKTTRGVQAESQVLEEKFFKVRHKVQNNSLWVKVWRTFLKAKPRIQSARLEAANDSVVDDGSIKIGENETDAVPQQTFKEAEKEITDFVNSLLRSILPKIVGGSGDAKLSPQCTAGMMKIFGTGNESWVEPLLCPDFIKNHLSKWESGTERHLKEIEP